MGLLGRLFGKNLNEPKLLERADGLLSYAQVIAASMLQPLADEFPLIRNVSIDNQLFFLTVAGVFVAATRFRAIGVEGALKDRVDRALTSQMREWNVDGIRGFADCGALYDQEHDRLRAAGHDPRFTSSDALGLWVVWNLIGHAPESRDEIVLVRGTGAMLVHSFYGYWDD
jgi:hypothetical protein